MRSDMCSRGGNGTAQICAVTFVAPTQLAQIPVWSAPLAAAMLAVGYLTRIVGLALLLATAVFAWWVAPHAWTSAAVFGAWAFDLVPYTRPTLALTTHVRSSVLRAGML